MIWHWHGLVEENKYGPEGFGHAVMDKSTLFYVDNGLLASTNPVWIQWLFALTIGLFYQVGM